MRKIFIIHFQFCLRPAAVKQPERGDDVTKRRRRRFCGAVPPS
jgi:hypothetical protein